MLAAVTAVCCPAAFGSPGILLAKGSDSGTALAFSTTGRALHPSSLLIRITAKPKKAVEVSWDTECARGGKGKVRSGEYTINGRKLRKVKKGFKRPDDCLVNVFAAYEDASQEGKLKIEVFARGGLAERG